MKKTLLTLFLIGGSTFFSCLFNSCDIACSQRCVSISNISLRVLNNAGNVPVVPSNEELPAKACMLSLAIQDTVGGCLAFVKDPFTPPAFAMKKSCPMPVVAGSYVITSDADFDQDHLAGSSLNDLFYSQTPVSGKSNGDVDFYLLHEPQNESVHRFTITIISSRRDTLTSTTTPIKLIKS